jgi:hypothetical protein
VGEAMLGKINENRKIPASPPGPRPGLPDGIFSKQKSQFGYILEWLALKDVGKFYGHLVYFTAISYSLWPFGIFRGYFGIFFPVLVCYTKKNLATFVIFCGYFGIFVPFWYVIPRKIWQPFKNYPYRNVNDVHVIVVKGDDVIVLRTVVGHASVR